MGKWTNSKFGHDIQFVVLNLIISGVGFLRSIVILRKDDIEYNELGLISIVQTIVAFLSFFKPEKHFFKNYLAVYGSIKSCSLTGSETNSLNS